MGYLKSGLVFFACLLTVMTFGQKKMLSGTLYDSLNNQAIGNGTVRNIMTGKVSLTNRFGMFSAEVSEGQVLAFSANGFYSDTLNINTNLLEMGRMLVTLKPLPSTLEGVTVTSSYNRYQLDSLARRREFLQTIGENKIPVVGRANDLGFGVAVNIDHFSKRENRKRKARSFFEIMEEDAYVNYRWNESVVRQYTGFSGDELLDFMAVARPSHDWLRKNPEDQDMPYYINSQLKKYRRIKKAS